MLIIKTNQPNSLVVTVSQNSELSNPEYLFSFTHIFSKQNVSFIPVDVSLHSSRYDEFYFVEGLECDEIHFPYEGQYLYSISEQPAGSGNLNPALAYNVVENGEAQIIVQSAITVNSQFDVFISSNEDNSNFIFAPDEPNPTPNITCTPTGTQVLTPTPTPSVTPTITPTNTSTNTPTPSLTPTNTQTPTPSSTPPNDNPSTLGALWWNQYSNPSFLNLSGVDILSVIDGINATTLFQTKPGNRVQFQNGIYPSIAINASGGTRDNTGSFVMSSLNGEYSGTTDFTIFSRYYYSGSSGESVLTSSDSGGGANGNLYDGSTAPYRWYQNKIAGGNVEFNVWADPNTANGFVNFNQAVVSNTWINQAFRAYQNGADYVIELWVNNVLTNNNQTTYTSVPPVLNPGIVVATQFQGSIAEQFQFNKKLDSINRTCLSNLSSQI